MMPRSVPSTCGNRAALWSHLLDSRRTMRDMRDILEPHNIVIETMKSNRLDIELVRQLLCTASPWVLAPSFRGAPGDSRRHTCGLGEMIAT